MEEKQAVDFVKEQLNNYSNPTNTTESGMNTSFSRGVSVPVASTSDTETSQVSTSGLIEKALNAAKELKEQLDRKEKLILQERELEARRLLSGRAEAGIPERQKTQEEINKDAARALLANTGLKIF